MLQQQQQQHQMMLNPMLNYPINSYNFPQASANVRTLSMNHNPIRQQQSLGNNHASESSLIQPSVPSQQQQASLVRLSNIKALDLLKRKKPTNHVLAALRQSKIDDDSDLISEAGRMSRRSKTFKFQFEKSKNNDKLEIEASPEASLVPSATDAQPENETDHDLVITQEESSPAVVLIKKIESHATPVKSDTPNAASESKEVIEQQTIGENTEAKGYDRKGSL